MSTQCHRRYQYCEVRSIPAMWLRMASLTSQRETDRLSPQWSPLITNANEQAYLLQQCSGSLLAIFVFHSYSVCIRTSNMQHRAAREVAYTTCAGRFSSTVGCVSLTSPGSKDSNSNVHGTGGLQLGTSVYALFHVALVSGTMLAPAEVWELRSADGRGWSPACHRIALAADIRKAAW